MAFFCLHLQSFLPRDPFLKHHNRHYGRIFQFQVSSVASLSDSRVSVPTYSLSVVALSLCVHMFPAGGFYPCVGGTCLDASLPVGDDLSH